jgi:hypothetical protein
VYDDVKADFPNMNGITHSEETKGVFGSLCHLEFAFPLEISHPIQAHVRFCGVFVSPYQLREARFCRVFVNLSELRLAQRLKIIERSKLLHKAP